MRSSRPERNRSGYFLQFERGTDQKTRQHFLDLSWRRWAITDALSGIHATALSRGSPSPQGPTGARGVVPLSNLLLYGETMGVSSLRAA